MKAEEHPEYPFEETHLEETLDKLSRYMSKEHVIPSFGVHHWAAQGVYRAREIILAQLEDVRNYPYHGRLDINIDNQNVTTYVGRQNVTVQLEKQEFLVISWDSPIGRIFVQGQQKDVQWRGGHRRDGGVGKLYKGKLELKRRYKLGDLRLLEIDDEIDRRQGRELTSTVGDAFIVRQLYQRGDQRLRDIVETIQQEQAGIIFAPSEQVLVLNGVAGSGKTSIALHRLAWLLGEHADKRVEPQRAIVFGPNRLFVRYIDDLIVGLGRGKVVHTTFQHWALRRLRIALNRSSRGKFLDVHPDERSSKQRRELDSAILERRSALRGSMRMRSLMKKYVQHVLDQIVLPEEGVTFASEQRIAAGVFAEDKTVSLTHNDLDQAFELARSLPTDTPFDRRRQSFFQTVQATIEGRFRARYKVMSKRDLDALDSFMKSEAVSGIWPPLIVPEAYIALLSDHALLTKLGGDLFTPSELDALVSVPASVGSSKSKMKLEVEDVAVMYCLNELVSGPSAPEYDHIVVDEAQDLSPLEFSILKSVSRNRAFTIVGDVAQSIHVSRGLRDWDALYEIFALESINRQEITRSYRSTREIVEFANALLKRARGSDATLAQPFTRPGARPAMLQVSSQDALCDQLASTIHQLRNMHPNDIALLTRTAREARALAKQLKKRGHLDLRVILSPNDRIRDKGSIIIAPIRAVKGLEFDAVIVVDASAKTYPGQSNQDGPLLYVAATRALHSLTLISRGAFSPILENATQLADYKILKKTQ